MNFEFLRTLHGFINFLQVCLGFAALFACSFIWRDTDLYFQFIYKGFGWQSVILAILFFTWLFALMIFLSNLFDRDVVGTVGKFKLLILYVICLVFLVISAALESWYISRSGTQGKYPDTVYHPRFIAVTIFNWILVVSYIVQILIKNSHQVLKLQACQRTDNKDKLQSVESTYKYMWEAFGLPLLFVLLGLKFDGSNLTWDIFFLCFGVISIGLFVRFIVVIFITLPTHINFKEQIVVALSLLPRATFQADLAPTLVVIATRVPDYVQDAELVLKVCILSVLVTAPIFDVLLNIFGLKFLDVHTPQKQHQQREQQLLQPLEKSSHFDDDKVDEKSLNVRTTSPWKMVHLTPKKRLIFLIHYFVDFNKYCFSA
ncbi:unnamed protein product [Caenorhabditis angaria]|uniref:Cation/H+ exchanger transmembrane domain-containing protein n=1 Tax=Caenorhabditis angaria TaxID=860376 RepID=A0A9P1J0A0_9PELO|nr:unnamed protein product [Caenorhabditis angaria]